MHTEGETGEKSIGPRHETDETRPAGRKPYRSPKLTDYGSLRAVTAAGMRNNADHLGGNPHFRS